MGDNEERIWKELEGVKTCVSDLKGDLSALQTDVKWIKGFFIPTAIAVIVGVIKLLFS